MKKAQWTSFYLEALLLVAVFVAMVLVLTGVFSAARTQSRRARELSRAVTLAANTAEAVSASSDGEELLKVLNENGNASARADVPGVTARYDADGTPDPAGDFRVDVSWDPEPAGKGELVAGEILVSCGGEDPVYRLETLFYREGAEP